MHDPERERPTEHSPELEPVEIYAELRARLTEAIPELLDPDTQAKFLLREQIVEALELPIDIAVNTWAIVKRATPVDVSFDT